MGSSSLKWVALDATTEATCEQGEARWSGTEVGRHEAEISAALQRVDAVAAIGHRVVHGGPRFRQGVLLDEQVRNAISDLSELAPLHNPAAVAGIDAATRHYPGVPQVVAFDTAFHSTIPEAAATYAVPWDWTERWGLRRFGFHGLSVQYAVQRVSELLGRTPDRMVVCHLGAGCSITAVRAGLSMDTSMGFTPLEGLMMAQRSGSVDPGLLLYLLTRQGVSAATLDETLNEKSGLLGVSGITADMREVLAAAAAGQARAQLATDMFTHRLVATVGAMIGSLRGLDALVFTGGIGEHSVVIRGTTCAAFDYLGLELDPTRNEANPVDADMATASSKVRVMVVTAREDLAILRETKRVLGWA